jgi:hypothetical protein
LVVTAVAGLLALVSRGAAQAPSPPPPAPTEGRQPEGSGESENGEAREEEPRSPFEDHIETDRDAFTPAVTTVGKDRLVIESSYTFQDNPGVPATHSFPELLVRYGVMERVELRLGWNYEVGGKGNEASGSALEEDIAGPSIKREQRLLYGLKASLSEQDRWVPESSVIVQGLTPTGGDTTATQFSGAYVFGWELPNRWRADAAVRFESQSEQGERFGIWAPSAVLRVPLGERWQVHAEYFGLFSEDRRGDFVNHFFSPGAHYLVTPNLEVGVRVGWGLNEQSARFFSNVGFGCRF